FLVTADMAALDENLLVDGDAYGLTGMRLDLGFVFRPDLDGRYSRDLVGRRENDLVALAQDSGFYAADDNTLLGLVVVAVDILHREAQWQRDRRWCDLEAVKDFQQRLAVVPRQMIAARGDHVAMAGGKRNDMRRRYANGGEIFGDVA